MSAPRQMTKETLNALKGWPQMNAVDFEAKLDSSVSSRLPAGSVVHVSPTKTFIPGVGNVATMPLFTFQGSDDPDVVNEGGDPATEKGVFIAINPTGVMMALVAIGAYELVSTNYNTLLSYAPNDHLTSPLTLASSVSPGMLTRGTIKTNCIVGVVSRGVVDNGYGFDALAFWPYYLPPIS